MFYNCILNITIKITGLLLLLIRYYLEIYNIDPWWEIQNKLIHMHEKNVHIKLCKRKIKCWCLLKVTRGIIKKEALINFPAYKNKGLNNDKTAYMLMKICGVHMVAWHRSIIRRETEKSFEFMEVLIGIVRGTERQ